MQSAQTDYPTTGGETSVQEDARFAIYIDRLSAN